MVLDNSQLSAILEYLEQNDCCPRCCLRLLNQQDYKAYISSELVKKKIEDYRDESPNPTKKIRLESSCILCLGLLEEGCNPENLMKIVTKVEERNHQFKNFFLQLSIPITMSLRQHLFYSQLKSKFPDMMKDNWAPPTIKEVWKWILGDFIAEHFHKEFSVNSDFFITVDIGHLSIRDECTPLKKAAPSYFKHDKVPFSRPAVINALNSLSAEELAKLYPEPLKPSLNSFVYEKIFCSHASIYFGGRYLKLSRELCQTPWLIDDVKQRETSVQELITNVFERYIQCEKIVFSSSGREDVDVRMLGSGRPFLLELHDPKLEDLPLAQIQQKINEETKDIEIHHLTAITKGQVPLLKVGEEKKKKTYSALCVLSRPVDVSDLDVLAKTIDLELTQRTPIRVLHRRTNLIRKKMIYEMKAEIISAHQLRINLVTQAGTYIKEFIHGDFGRTTPNLATLLNLDRADIQELDVLNVELDWPPEDK